MISKNKDFFLELRRIISIEKKIIRELNSLYENLRKTKDVKEKEMISSQIKSLKISLKKVNKSVLSILEKISLIKPLKPLIKRDTTTKEAPEKIPLITKSKLKNLEPTEKIEFSKLEKKTIKRFKKKEKEKIVHKKVKKASKYVKTATKVFSNFSKLIVNKDMFRTLKRDLIKANLQFVPINYISVILFTTLLSIIASIFIFLFFLFFNFGAKLPIITIVTESIGTRFLKIFWILFAIPIGTFLIGYFYPSLERKSAEEKINQELPFATIHMAAISSSMIEPSKIFSIIISTKEYPHLEKQLTKLMNEINVYGYNLASALRSIAFNNPSTKLGDLLNSMATTINSGGDLHEFFDKRSQSLLFEYRIEREKQTRMAETFMDIYISVVIAAPMILMLLLIMMKVSGLGISFSTSMITLIMVLGVSMINIIFLTFLQLKQPSK